MKLRVTKTALRQIEQSVDFVRRESQQGAARLQDRIRAAVDLALSHPSAGQITNRAGVRRLALVPFPYVIYYRVGQGEVVLLRFRHTARKSYADPRQP